MNFSCPRIIVILSVVAVASGCVNRASAKLEPGTDLRTIKTYYVVHQPKDTHGIHNLIRDKLLRDGIPATAGPELAPGAYKADALITYVDRWMWDMTLYLLELTVTVRNPTSNFPLAVGNSYHTSLTRKSPEEMVEEVMTNIFTAGQQSATQAAP